MFLLKKKKIMVNGDDRKKKGQKGENGNEIKINFKEKRSAKTVWEWGPLI